MYYADYRNGRVPWPRTSRDSASTKDTHAFRNQLLWTRDGAVCTYSRIRIHLFSPDIGFLSPISLVVSRAADAITHMHRVYVYIYSVKRRDTRLTFWFLGLIIYYLGATSRASDVHLYLLRRNIREICSLLRYINTSAYFTRKIFRRAFIARIMYVPMAGVYSCKSSGSFLNANAKRSACSVRARRVASRRSHEAGNFLWRNYRTGNHRKYAHVLSNQTTI